MKKTFLLGFASLFLPTVAFAQGSVQTFFTGLMTFVSSTLIPFLLGMAFLIFAINAIRFFVIGGSNQESQEKAKALALYGIMAFVFLIIFWGIINMLSSSIGLAGVNQTCSDYAVFKGISCP